MDHWNKKMFQFNKLHVFDVFFKQWDFVFYMDCGITVLNDVAPMVRCAKPGALLAHSDAYPRYQHILKCQFDPSSSLFHEMEMKYDLNVDYPQTTVMLYDTCIIEPDTVSELRDLCIQYPLSISNDQGILALYFTHVRPLWKQIPLENETTCFYDYLARTRKRKPYIMLKVTHICDDSEM